MDTPITVQQLFESQQERLELYWIAGKGGQSWPLENHDEGLLEADLISTLDLIHPRPVQVLGEGEIDYLEGLGKNSLHDALDTLFSVNLGLLIVTDNRRPFTPLIERAEHSNTALIGSQLGASEVIGHLSGYIHSHLAQRTTLHGVFLDVLGVGTLLTGDSGIGKSELALELVTRGHQLIADDAPEFMRIGRDTLHGTCPELLRNFLEVRGLGLLNIRAMFGEGATKYDEDLHLILQLRRIKQKALYQIDRLTGSGNEKVIMGISIPEIVIPVAPGRNLAVIVEAAVRNHILSKHGYDVTEEFTTRQMQYIGENS